MKAVDVPENLFHNALFQILYGVVGAWLFQAAGWRSLLDPGTPTFAPALIGIVLLALAVGLAIWTTLQKRETSTKAPRGEEGMAARSMGDGAGAGGGLGGGGSGGSSGGGALFPNVARIGGTILDRFQGTQSPVNSYEKQLKDAIFDRPLGTLPRYHVNEFRGLIFENQPENVDGKRFINCDFRQGVRLYVSGRAPPTFENCKFNEDARFLADGFAEATLLSFIEIEKVIPGTFERLTKRVKGQRTETSVTTQVVADDLPN